MEKDRQNNFTGGGLFLWRSSSNALDLTRNVALQGAGPLSVLFSSGSLAAESHLAWAKALTYFWPEYQLINTEHLPWARCYAKCFLLHYVI